MTAFLDLIDEESDKEKFKRLYEKYRNFMAYIARQKVSSFEDTEEVLQEAFLYIAENFNKIGDIDSNRTKSYLAVITEGFAIKKYKSESKHSYNCVDSDFEATNTEINFDEYDKSDLKTVIDSLDDELKNLIYLTYVYGYTSKEIAKEFDMSDSNVRKKLQLARKEIKNKLGGNTNE